MKKNMINEALRYLSEMEGIDFKDEVTSLFFDDKELAESPKYAKLFTVKDLDGKVQGAVDAWGLDREETKQLRDALLDNPIKALRGHFEYSIDDALDVCDVDWEGLYTVLSTEGYLGD